MYNVMSTVSSCNDVVGRKEVGSILDPRLIAPGEITGLEMAGSRPSPYLQMALVW